MQTLQKITDRVKSFEDACDVLSISAADIIPFKGDNADQLAVNALCKLIAIARALNEGWTPDWDNSSQRKWYPWFWMNNPGFRFYDTLCDFTFARATGGSRLCFKSAELAEYAGKQFLDIYKSFLS